MLDFDRVASYRYDALKVYLTRIDRTAKSNYLARLRTAPLGQTIANERNLWTIRQLEQYKMIPDEYGSLHRRSRNHANLQYEGKQDARCEKAAESHTQPSCSKKLF